MKILIISPNTYPLQSPRAFRTAELSEQLVKMGHEVLVYSVQGGFDYKEYQITTGVKVMPIPHVASLRGNDGSYRYTLIDRFFFHFFKRLLVYPEIEFMYRVPKIVRDNPGFDLLITVAYPHTIHSGAAMAKKKYPNSFPKCWIADCGDPFMLNPFVKYPGYMKKYEDEWCSGCDYITVPTDSSYHGYYEQYWKKIKVIPQGFDFSKTPIEKYKKHPVPTFLFMGTVYPGVRDPHSFMEYLLKFDRPYHFIMMMKTPLEDKYLVESNGQIEYVIGKGRKDVIRECSKVDFLINITNPNSLQTPSKLIDYGISGRPILDIDNSFSDDSLFLQFLDGNYQGQHIIDFLDNYKIENVAQEFLRLAETRI